MMYPIFIAWICLLLLAPSICTAQDRVSTRQLFRYHMAGLAGFENPDGSIEQIEFPTANYFEQRWPEPTNPGAKFKWAITRMIFTDQSGEIVEPRPGDWYVMRPNGDVGVILEVREGADAELEQYRMDMLRVDEYEVRSGRIEPRRELEDGSRVEGGELVKSAGGRQ